MSINNTNTYIMDVDIDIDMIMKDFDLTCIDTSSMLTFTHDNLEKQNKVYESEYDDLTNGRYKAMRRMKTCPICDEQVNSHAFKVPKIWDSITGEFTSEDDPYGPIYFHPICLIECFYCNRMNGLLEGETDEGATGGYYEAVPGDGLGAGEEMNTSRGSYPELFLWRVPINDCYLEPGLPRSIPLKGPKLNRSDIVKLNELANKIAPSEWSGRFKKLPNIINIYDTYMEAINKNPNTSKIVCGKYDDSKFLANLAAAKKLSNM